LQIACSATVDSFFKSLKGRTGLAAQLENPPRRRRGFFECKNGLDNPRPKNLALGCKSPVAFERRATLFEQLNLSI
jgi:hypothetical protein